MTQMITSPTFSRSIAIEREPLFQEIAMLLHADDSQLVLVDYQAKLMPAIFEGDRVLANAKRLAQLAQWLSVPCWGTEQVPEKLGALVPELAVFCRQVLPKSAFSAVADGLADVLVPAAKHVSGNARSLPKHLQKAAPAPVQRGCLVLAGVEAHVCLLQTALELLEQEFEVWVVTDACSSRTERNRDAAFDRLAGAGAELVTTEMVGFEWLRDSGHANFRDWQALIR